MIHRVLQAFLLGLLATAACDGTPPRSGVPAPDAAAGSDLSGADSDGHAEELPPPPPEGRRVFVYRDGKREEQTEPQARAAGLAVVDLGNYWVPFIFSEQDEGGPRLPNEFRQIYRKLANDWPYESRTMAEARRVLEARAERARQARIAELKAEGLTEEQIREALGLEDPAEPEPGADGGAAAEVDAGVADAGVLPSEGPGGEDHYLEVYGIPPSLSVLRKRALGELDRPCFAGIDFDRIRRFDGFVAYRSNETAEVEAKKGQTFARQLRAAMEKLEVETPEALLAHPANKLSSGLVRIALRYEALAEAQRLMVCEGLYGPADAVHYRPGGLDWKTHQALTAFERKNRIFAWGFFGNETLAALGRTPAERLFDAFVRVVNERVSDSLGVIEDGSAVDREGKQATYRDAAGEVRDVPNLVAEYTAELIRHMDLGTPEKLVAFLGDHDEGFFDTLLVAAPLPARPPYYADVMDLHAEIDRGDVWYDFPETPDGKRRAQPRKRMPMTTLFVRWNDQDIPLVSMNTTIGSWRTELAPDGYEYYKYKNSDVGPRVWREIVAGPVWLPPDTTPVGDLIKTVSYRGRLLRVPNHDEFGPWYASAYGLVAAFHMRPVERRDGTVDYLDNGIRSHGSVDYNSILRRYSHGCHRLYNHLAIRMFDFVLRRRPYRRVGDVPAGYSRQVEVDGDAFIINIASRGYRYELVDPVPIEVLRGRVRGSQRTAIEYYMPKPGTEYGSDAQFLPAGWTAPDTADAGTAEEAAPDGAAPPAKGAAGQPGSAVAGPVEEQKKTPKI
jgi:hypothetical protein